MKKMKEYKISSFIEEIPTYDNHVVLYNRMFGGAVCISQPDYDHLKSSSKINSDSFLRLLKDNNIIVDNDFNENEYLESQNRKILENASSGKLLNCLELSVSEECNYACIYCKFLRYKDKKSQKIMKKEVALAAIYDFLKITQNVDSPIIYFGTAEPLINWDVIEYTTKFIRKDYSKVKLNLITNGSLMTKKKLEFCKKYNISVGLSIDGRPDTQRYQRRPLLSNTDSHQVIIDILEYCKKIDFKISCLSCTYNQLGFLEDVEYLIHLCNQFDIQEIDIDFDSGILTKNSDVSKLTDELLDAYIKSENSGLYVFGYWLIAFYNIINAEKIKSFCGNVIGKSVCITTDGSFKLCGYETKSICKYSKIIDHINSASVNNIYKSYLPSNNSNCFGCILEGVCVGQCMLTEPNKPMWVNTCLLYKNATEKLLKYKITRH
jgi:uncharacterized protein